MLFPLMTGVMIDGGRQISVVDYGARPDSAADATTAVARAIAAAGEGETVVFPKGEYHFHREHGARRDLFLSNSDVVNPRHIAILIENRKRLRLKGMGARLVFHDRIIPFAVLKSREIALEGFEVDWARPLMSQATVLASDRDGVTLGIDAKAYPYVVEDGKLFFTDRTWRRAPWGFMQFDPATRGVAYGTGDAGCLGSKWHEAKVTEPEPGVVRLSFPNDRLPTIGHTLVARHGVRDHAGTVILDSRGVTLTDMAYRHTSGLGILAQYSQDLTFRRVEIAPSLASKRMFAGHDDGIHLSNCKGKVLVEGCRFEGLMDDPINVHGTSVPIVRRMDARRLRFRFAHGQSVGLRFGDVGDEVSFLDHETLLSRGTGRIAAIERLGDGEVELTFRDPIPEDTRDGDALENLTWTPSFTVRKSIFGTVRARGLLVSTPRRVIVEDNVFRSSGTAILIAGDANNWYESGAVRDVTIRRNRFENCLTSPYQFCEAAISVCPEVRKTGETPFHRGIRIEKNVFETFDAPLLWAKSAGDLTFVENTIRATDAYRPWHSNREGLTFLGCRDVRVVGNRIEGDFRGTGVKVEGGRPETIKVEGWSSSAGGG